MSLHLKVLIILVLGLSLLVAQVACKTITVPITVTWTQEISDTSLFGGWEIYSATSEKGTYSLVVNIPFTDASNIYSYTKEVTAPSNTTVWFKMRSYNKNGIKSDWSNIVSETIN